MGFQRWRSAGWIGGPAGKPAPLRAVRPSIWIDGLGQMPCVFSESDLIHMVNQFRECGAVVGQAVSPARAFFFTASHARGYVTLEPAASFRATVSSRYRV